MGKTIEGIANPPLLIWARESAGYGVDEVAKKVQVKPERLAQWEAGERRPTLSQLRKLAWVYRRPMAVFHLQEPPPATYEPPHDFRLLVPDQEREYSPALRLEVRKAHRRRRLALQIYGEAGGPTEFSLETSPREEHESVGGRIRQELGIRYADQMAWVSTDGREAFNNWRSALEKAGVLVFQARGVDTREMLGFSVGQRPLPAVVVNIKGTYTLRTFTMLHELAHVMLHIGGLCDLREDDNARGRERAVETFCNYVAGASLVPRSHLLQEREVVRHGDESVWSDKEISLLARQYGVSREALLRRLLICRRTSRRFYEHKREQYLKMYARMRRRRQQDKGFAHPTTLAISTVGPTLARLVLRSYADQRVGATDAAELLGLRLKHLERLQAEVRLTPS